MLRSIGKNVIAKAGGHGGLGLLLAVAIAVFAAPLAHAAPAKTFTVSGKVTSAATKAAVSGANVALAGTSATLSAVTGATGNYSIGKVPTGAYTMTVSAPNFATSTQSVNVSKATTVNVALNPVVASCTGVTVAINGPSSANVGATVTLTGVVTNNGSCIIKGYQWAQTGGTTSVIKSPATVATDVVLGGNLSAYKDALIQALKLSPIDPAQLVPGVKLQQINYVNKGLQDRFQVVGINNFAYDEMGKLSNMTFQLTVTTTDGKTFSATATVATAPWAINPGLRTVPIDVTVLLQGKCGETFDATTQTYKCPASTTFAWDWVKDTKGHPIIPKNSKLGLAPLSDATTRNPYFKPDLPGVYQITENVSHTTMTIHAGTWRGVIDPISTFFDVYGDGLPAPDDTCLGCHNDSFAPDMFTPWRTTGHAQIFTQNLQGINKPGSHYGSSCFQCHTVGFNINANNLGFDDIGDAFFSGSQYKDFISAITPASPACPSCGTLLDPAIADPWIEFVSDFSGLARLSNIQCENCHGPQDGTIAHPCENPDGTICSTVTDQNVAARISLSPEVCASCHGEPARHGRYQQWELSSHADYKLATERGTGTNGSNCTRCHSGNGFVVWSEHDFDPAEDLSGTAPNSVEKITWNADTVQPQVCAACHEPHDTGNVSGIPNTAKVRKMGDTSMLLAGFIATGVGKGATCMTCHNSRAGVAITDPTSKKITGWITRNDDTWNQLTDAQKTGTPHHGVLADLIMGQNAYFVTASDRKRGGHSNIPDVCIACHMEKTLPPQPLYINGTNHTFAADPKVCGNCHGTPASPAVTAANEDSIITSLMSHLAGQLGQDYMDLMTTNYPITIVTSATGDCPSPGKVADTNNPITKVEWIKSTSLNITLLNGAVCTGANPGNSTATVTATLPPAGIYAGTPGSFKTLYSLSTTKWNGNLEKAGWNYLLSFEEGRDLNEAVVGETPGTPVTQQPAVTARGVHNPAFSQLILKNACAAVGCPTIVAPTPGPVVP